MNTTGGATIMGSYPYPRNGIVEIDGLKGILEIKSMNSNQFYSCFDPKPEHLIQINVYMFCTGIPRGVLLYECKDDQELREFYVKQDHSILSPILEKILYVFAKDEREMLFESVGARRHGD
jgi:hypothetical protein